jgi:uncharacterized protein YjbI with pentapeptide repeats
LRTRLPGASSAGRSWSGAAASSQFQQHHLRGANFEGAQLHIASLEAAELRGAYLKRAQLLGASLKAAKLQAAFLDLAHLQGALLDDANLESASLFQTVVWQASHPKAETLKVFFPDINTAIPFDRIGNDIILSPRPFEVHDLIVVEYSSKK